jgi:hypothetical protein
MKISISPGLWMVYVGVVYFAIGMIDIFVYRFCDPELLSLGYCVILSLPLWIPPLGRWVGVSPFWKL